MAAASTVGKGLQYSRLVEAVRFRTLTSSSSSYPRAGALLPSPADEAEPARASSRPPRPPARRFHSHPPPAPSHPPPPPVRSSYVAVAAADSHSATTTTTTTTMPASMRLSLHASSSDVVSSPSLSLSPSMNSSTSDPALASPSALPPLPPSPLPPTSAPTSAPEEPAPSVDSSRDDSDTRSFVSRVKLSSPWGVRKEKKTTRRQIREGKRPSGELYADASGLWEARAEAQQQQQQQAHRVSLKRVLGRLHVARRETGASADDLYVIEDEDAASVQSDSAAVLASRAAGRPASIFSSAVESGSEDEFAVEDEGDDEDLVDIEALLEDGLLHPFSAEAVKRRTASMNRARAHAAAAAGGGTGTTSTAPTSTPSMPTPTTTTTTTTGARRHTRHRSHEHPPPPRWDADHPNPAFASQAPLAIRVGPQCIDLLNDACGSDWPAQLERLCLGFAPPAGVPAHAAQLVRVCVKNGRMYRIVAEDFREEDVSLREKVSREGGGWKGKIRRARGFL